MKTVTLTERQIDTLRTFIEYFIQKPQAGVMVRNQETKVTDRELQALDGLLK